MSELRDYQSGALEAVACAQREGCRKQLVSLATGLGKTVIFANLPRIGFRRLLIIAHREELLGQAAGKLRHWNEGLRVEINQAERKADLQALRFFHGEAYAVCASIATIGRSGSSRLTRYKPEDFDAVVVDEAHHATADSYRSALRHLRAGEPGGPLLLGVTATPFRADGVNLAEIFDRVVFEHDISWGIDNGHLADVRAVLVDTSTDLSQIHARKDDFVQGELAEAVNNSLRNAQTVRAYLDRAADRKALVFAAGLEHSRALRDQFNAAGVPAEHLDGETESRERRGILERLASGKTRVVCNMGVLTEGFDEPSISAVIMARPTKSPVLYTQMIGRGTRLCPGKTDLLLINMVDRTGKHDVLSAANVFGLPPSFNLAGGSAREAKQKIEQALREGVPFQQILGIRTLLDVERIRNRYREASRVVVPTVPAEIAAVARFRWVPLMGESFAFSANGITALARKDLLGHYRLEIVRRVKPTETATRLIGEARQLGLVLRDAGDGKIGVRPASQMPEEFRQKLEASRDEVLEALAKPTLFEGDFANARLAVQRAEVELRSRIPKVFWDPSAGWRSQPATPKQIRALRSMRIPFKDGVTKGEAADLLTRKFSEKQAAQAAGG